MLRLTRRPVPARPSKAPRVLIVAIALLAMFGMTLSGATVAVAQDGTPMASPTAGPCDAPALPPGTPSPMEEASPEASPAHDMSAMATPDLGEPVAEATPVEEAAPAGTPADETTAAEITAAVENVINCLNGGNYEGTLALFTTDGLLSTFDIGNPYDILAFGFLEGTVFGNVEISDAQTYDDGRVSARVDYIQGQYQATSERWYLTQDGDYWKVDEIEFLSPTPEGDTAVVGVTMTEYAFTPNVSTITQMPVIILHGVNDGAEPHEIAVVRLPEGVTIDQVLADPSLEEQVEFIGAAFYEPGQEGDLALVGLEPGVYTLVCFIPAPDGEPHILKGMVTEITVTAPEPAVPEASPAASPAA